MAEQEQNKQPVAESKQEVKIITRTRSLTRRQHTDRNYPMLKSGKEIIIRNYNNIKSIMQRNYRRFSY